MTRSMTGYASRTGQGLGFGWNWDLRGVNGRGFELRLRVPDWIEGLEPAVRATVQKDVTRGNLSLTLKLTREEAGGFALDQRALAAAVELIRKVEDEAAAGDLTLGPMTAADLLQMRGVLQAAEADAEQTAALRGRLLEDLAVLLEEFDAARRREGEALEALLGAQLAELERLLSEARQVAAERLDAIPERIGAALERLRGAAGDVDEARVLQEVALIATRADVTEEMDRLQAHLATARAHLAEEGPKGRKLDFLVQELNREANTLCSKSQAVPLTQVGLALKAVIDQMREQVQNLE